MKTELHRNKKIHNENVYKTHINTLDMQHSYYITVCVDLRNGWQEYEPNILGGARYFIEKTFPLIDNCANVNVFEYDTWSKIMIR